MKNLSFVLTLALMAGCAGMGRGGIDRSPAFSQASGDMGAASASGAGTRGMNASARNLCEVMRNFAPYDPDECRSN